MQQTNFRESQRRIFPKDATPHPYRRARDEDADGDSRPLWMQLWNPRHGHRKPGYARNNIYNMGPRHLEMGA